MEIPAEPQLEITGTAIHRVNRLERLSEIARAFLRLGLTAFGGPLAHLACFRREVVERRGWLDEHAFASLVAYCQFMPGPTSSQVGFLLGWHRGGLPGAVIAWGAFTAPSAIAMTAAALLCGGIAGTGPWLHGLKAAVLAVVAQAVLAMARSLCPDAPRATIAAAVAGGALLAPLPWTAMALLVPAGLAGALVRGASDAPSGTPLIVPGRGTTFAALAVLAVLVAGTALAVQLVGGPLALLLATCFQAGGLVFGGGHVVLPLLRDPLVHGGVISDSAFLAGYGAAQMVPGPLFTVATWVGAQVGGLSAALLATIAIFAPGLLLALGGMRLHQRLLTTPGARRVVAGLNAGVVGLLGAALWDPLGVTAIHDARDVALALAAFVALQAWRAPSWAVVGGCCALAAFLW